MVAHDSAVLSEAAAAQSVGGSVRVFFSGSMSTRFEPTSTRSISE